MYFKHTLYNYNPHSYRQMPGYLVRPSRPSADAGCAASRAQKPLTSISLSAVGWWRSLPFGGSHLGVAIWGSRLGEAVWGKPFGEAIRG